MPVNQPENTLESWLAAMWPQMVKYDYLDNTIKEHYGNGIVGVGPESIAFSFSWLEAGVIINVGLENVTRFDAGEFLHQLFPIN